MSKHYGECALCKKHCNLTFEHIPPKNAFNSTPAKPVTGDLLIGDDDRMPWDISGLKYSNQQKGMGKYSLCNECNNNTGSWYGEEYINFSHIADNILQHISSEQELGLYIKELHPLQLIKQVLSMFCSINNFDDTRIDLLRQFVLDKAVNKLDKSKYKICMYFTKSKFIKYAPLSVILKFDENNAETIALSEITAYPFGFILYFDPPNDFKYEGVDITSFADYHYDDVISITIPILVNEVNNIFPVDYRSKDEIIKCIKESKEELERQKNCED